LTPWGQANEGVGEMSLSERAPRPEVHPPRLRAPALAVVAAALVVLSLASSCDAASPTPNPTAVYGAPAKVEPVPSQSYAKITLSEAAVKRIGIQTVKLSETRIGGVLRKTIPYSAVIYDRTAKTWTYTNPAPLVFVRAPITVEYIDGDVAVLTAGPDVGTDVVSVGAIELYGTELKIG